MAEHVPVAPAIAAAVLVPAAIAVQAEPFAQGVLVPNVLIHPDVQIDAHVNVDVNVPVEAFPVAPVVEPARTASNSLHTDDLIIDGQPGDATRARQELRIVMDGGNVVHQSGPSQSSPLSDNSVNAKVSPPKNISVENHPEFIRNNLARIEYVDFLRSKGLLADFNNHQASKLSRVVNGDGIIIPTPVLQKEATTNGTTASTDAPPVSWVKIVKANIPKFSNLTDCNEVKFDSDGSAHLNPPKSFLVDARKNWDTSCIGHFVGGSFAFKLVKEHALKLWKEKGLANVIYNSKGFYIFKFKTAPEMRRFLAHKSVSFKGKRMYLGPWIEGTNFQKNVIPSVSVWVKFCEIPHSYWCSEGLSMISNAVGKLIQLDAATARLEPLKYAAMLIEVDYGSQMPDTIYVPVLNDVDGTVEKVRIDVLYSALPYSCKLCCAFGHSYARCSRNPENKKQNTTKVVTGKMTKEQFLGCDVEKDPEGSKRPKLNHVGTSSEVIKNTVTVNEDTSMDDAIPKSSLGSDSPVDPEDLLITENIESNIEMLVSEMSTIEHTFGNGTVAEADVEGDKVQVMNTNQGLEDDFDLVETNLAVDSSPDTIMVVTALPAIQEKPISLQTMEPIEEGEFIPSTSSTIKSRKNKVKIGSSVFIASQNKKLKNGVVDKEGFQQVLNRKSLRSQGDVTKSKRTQ